MATTKLERATAILLDVWVEGSHTHYRRGGWVFSQASGYDGAYDQHVNAALADVRGSIRGALLALKKRGLVKETGTGRQLYFYRLTEHDIRRARRQRSVREGRAGAADAAADALNGFGVAAYSDGGRYPRVVLSVRDARTLAALLSAKGGE